MSGSERLYNRTRKFVEPIRVLFRAIWGWLERTSGSIRAYQCVGPSDQWPGPGTS